MVTLNSYHLTDSKNLSTIAKSHTSQPKFWARSSGRSRTSSSKFRNVSKTFQTSSVGKDNAGKDKIGRPASHGVKTQNTDLPALGTDLTKTSRTKSDRPTSDPGSFEQQDKANGWTMDLLEQAKENEWTVVQRRKSTSKKVSFSGVRGAGKAPLTLTK